MKKKKNQRQYRNIFEIKIWLSIISIIEYLFK